MSANSRTHRPGVFGDRIKKARLRARLSQRDLAKQMGAQMAQVSKWEEGRTVPRPKTIAKLAEVLQIPIREFQESADLGDCEDTFGSRLRNLRLAKSWTLREMADKAGLSYPVISGWENSSVEPRISSLKKLSLLFDVTADYLLFGDQSEHDKS